MTSNTVTQDIRVDTGALTLVGDAWHPAGSSRGAVLLLHGGGQRRYSWRNTGSRLATVGWTAYAFDARGHGDSDRAPDGDYSATGLVDDAVHLVDWIGEKPVMVGASMGGLTALLAEGERGNVARALVLVDVVAHMEPVGIAHIQSFMASAPDGFASLEEAADAIAAYNPHRPRPRSVEGLRKNLRLEDDGRWHWHWDPAFLRAGSEPEREARPDRTVAAARRITVPTLLVRGADSDVVSEGGAREMQELIRHAEVVEVPAAGHMIAGDDNDVFTERLSGFLDELG
ncbi:alpha/beta hydrolase [Gryllotalpicola sp.]|uniref:alpha/beta fold hydrolase n=1 Tax=Gryllotalpicola sp. TaxID=1932787 RepID=UPI00260FFFFE|nr:alpha/beta hydrolase [Gryllotalpicola sp.]